MVSLAVLAANAKPPRKVSSGVIVVPAAKLCTSLVPAWVPSLTHSAVAKNPLASVVVK